jgi:type II secretory pathway component PulJ
MRRRRSIPTSRSERGVSIVEVLAALGIAGITLASVAQMFSMAARQQKGMSYRVEMQQGLRGAIDAIARDVRLAGACLPTNGEFVALTGADQPAGDRITIRAGQVRNNTACVKAVTQVAAMQGETSLTVDTTTGFAAGMLVYLRNWNGSGQITSVTGAGGNVLTIADGLAEAYPAGGTAYALDERVYELDVSDPANPILMITIDRGAPQQFAAGIQGLEFVYTLNRNCPACDTVDLPADTAEWRLVNDVLITATAKTVGAVRAEDQKTLVENTRAKPRNLLP